MDESTVFAEVPEKGNIILKIPIKPLSHTDDIHDGSFRVELGDLVKYATSQEIGDHQISPKDIDSVSVIGSSLYRHFDQPYTKLPKDLDLVVLLTGHYDESNIVIPQRTINAILKETYFGTDIIATAVHTLTPTPYFAHLIDGLMGRYSFEDRKGAADLHISYRSCVQVMNGIGHGDDLSEDLIKMGVPIIGVNNFNSFVENIQEPKREPLHTAVYNADDGFNIEIITV